MEEIPDIKRNGYTFTDGCGMISSGLLRFLLPKNKYKRLPSIVQIRYPGVKGVLMCYKEENRTVTFREQSMIKFKTPLKNPFGIVDMSKPYSYCTQQTNYDDTGCYWSPYISVGEEATFLLLFSAANYKQ